MSEELLAGARLYNKAYRTRLRGGKPPMNRTDQGRLAVSVRWTNWRQKVAQLSDEEKVA